MKTFNILLIAFSLSSCLKTAEQIQKEENKVTHKQQSQKMLADLMIKTKTLEDQVSQIQGSFEEINHNGKNEKAFQQDDIDELRVVIEEQDRKIEKIQADLAQQKKFIKDVTKTLSKLSKVLSK